MGFNAYWRRLNPKFGDFRSKNRPDLKTQLSHLQTYLTRKAYRRPDGVELGRCRVAVWGRWGAPKGRSDTLPPGRTPAPGQEPWCPTRIGYLKAVWQEIVGLVFR